MSHKQGEAVSTSFLSIRLRAKTRKTLERAAKLEEVTLSEHARAILERAAERWDARKRALGAQVDELAQRPAETRRIFCPGSRSEGELHDSIRTERPVA